MVAKRLSINVQRCEQNCQRLQQIALQNKLQAVFSASDFVASDEAEQQLYGGFLPNQDKPLLEQIRAATAEDFKRQQFYFSDDRYNRLLLNYRARYYADSLSANEQSDWLDSCRHRLTDAKNGFRSLEQQQKDIDQLLGDAELSQQDCKILHALSDRNREVAVKFSLNTAMK